MQTIREELQQMEDEQVDGYQLKSNEDIIDIISEFGNGETEFHTLDINRLVVENQRMKKVLDLIIDCQYNPNKTLANLNSSISNARNII